MEYKGLGLHVCHWNELGVCCIYHRPFHRHSQSRPAAQDGDCGNALQPSTTLYGCSTRRALSRLKSSPHANGDPIFRSQAQGCAWQHFSSCPTVSFVSSTTRTLLTLFSYDSDAIFISSCIVCKYCDIVFASHFLCPKWAAARQTGSKSKKKSVPPFPSRKFSKFLGIKMESTRGSLQMICNVRISIPRANC